MSLLPHADALAAAEAAAAPGDLFGELFAEDHTKLIVEVDRGGVRVCRLRRDRGTGIRRVLESRVRHRHLDRLDPEALRGLAMAVRHGEPVRGADRDCSDGDSRVDVDACVRLGEEALGATGNGSSWVRVVAGVQQILIARPDLGVVEETRRYAAVHAHVISRRGRQLRACRRSAGGTDVATLAARGAHLQVARKANQASAGQLDAVPAPTGRMPVILGPGNPAMLLHEACGHAMEADVAATAGSAYSGRQRVAAPFVTLLDDPGCPADAPLYEVDDEGEPAQQAVLIDRGVLGERLRDRRHGGGGHGRRLSYAYAPLPRMAGTVLAAGEEDPADIIRSTGQGIYVASIGGGDTDLASGRFTLRVDEGFLIEHGRITAPIRPAVLAGRGPEVLAGIDRVGSDLHVLGHTYLCRKLDQFPLVVNLGQPTVRVAELTVREG